MKISTVIMPMVFPLLLATTPDDRISIFVAYHHGDINVQYTFDCAYEQTCWLKSSPGQTPTWPAWRVEVSPHRMTNALTFVTAKAIEDDSIELSADLQLKIGGDSATMTIEPKGPNPRSITLKAMPTL